MREADPLLSVGAARVAPVPPVPQFGQSRLLQALEAVLEPLVTVLSLWLLVWLVEGDLSPAWLIASIVMFALAFPGRRKLRLPAHKVVAGTLFTWAWTAGLLLAVGFASGHISEFSPVVIAHTMWFVPAAQLAAHWALRRAAPHLVRLQGPALRAVVVGMNEQGCLLADRLGTAADTGIEMVGYFDDRTTDRQHGADRHRWLGRLSEIGAYVKTHQIQLI